ncbi:MAG: AAA family ATPase [Bacteroidia bacterium]|nr:AAA family ATPase [Bacteroidia bacterium]
MIPLRLSIQGIYSYQNKEEIDFQKLTQAQLFGIFGTTGSGKSTILEAISFALYGESERLNKKDNRGYNMMNLKSDRIFIDFEFASEEKTYRFVVNGKRNSRQFDQVGTLTRSAFARNNDEWLPIEAETAEEIIGLSYDNFKRTIIIPQGKFQDFLQLSDTDRTRMLREIFKLEKYELYNKAVSLEKKNQTEITRLETVINRMHEVTPEVLLQLENDIILLDQQLLEKEDTSRQKEKDIARLESLKILFDKITLQRKIVQDLHEKSVGFYEREQTLKEYESCLIDFKPLLDRKKEISENLESSTQNIRSKREAESQSKQDLKMAEDTFREISQEYNQRDTFLRKAAELELVIRLKSREINIAAFDERMNKGIAVCDQLRSSIRSMKDELAAKNVLLREIRDLRPDLNLLLKISEWFQKQQILSDDLKKQEAQFTDEQTLYTQIIQTKTDILKTTTLNPNQYSLEIPQLTDILRQDYIRLRKQIQENELARDKIIARHQLKDFAEKLVPGQPCPLCGSVHHPNIVDSGNVDYELKTAKQGIAVLEKEIQNLDKVIIRLENVEEQLIRQRKTQNTLTAQINQSHVLIDKHKAAFVWADYAQSTPAIIQQKIQEISTFDARTDLLNQEREAFETSITKEEQNLEKYLRTLDQIREQRHSEEVNFQAEYRSFQFISYDSLKLTENPRLEQLALEQKERFSKIEDLYQTSEQRIQRLRSNLSMLKGEISELEKQEKELTEKIVKINRQVNEKLSASAYTSLKIVEEILGLSLNIDTEKSVISLFKQQLHTANVTLAELESQVIGKKYDPEAFYHLQQELVLLRQEISEKTLQTGGLKKERDRLRNTLIEKAQLQQTLSEKMLRAEDIRTMKNMFSASGFVKYVSTIFLYNLCQAANDRFMKLTRGALSLEATDNNAFQVRDYLNNGQVRSVKTLSGGQTFQAALSLALSLADHVQQQAKSKQNFFFLDEGFGSQDKQSLRVIFETLKSLRKENRIVGVISHVEELQQEIGAYLQITNNPETGSKITTSWE